MSDLIVASKRVSKDLDDRKKWKSFDKFVSRVIWKKFDTAMSKAQIKYLTEISPSAHEIYEQETAEARYILDGALKNAIDSLQQARKILSASSETPSAPLKNIDQRKIVAPVYEEEPDENEEYDEEIEELVRLHPHNEERIRGNPEYAKHLERLKNVPMENENAENEEPSAQMEAPISDVRKKIAEMPGFASRSIDSSSAMATIAKLSKRK